MAQSIHSAPCSWGSVMGLLVVISPSLDTPHAQLALSANHSVLLHRQPSTSLPTVPPLGIQFLLCSSPRLCFACHRCWGKTLLSGHLVPKVNPPLAPLLGCALLMQIKSCHSPALLLLAHDSSEILLSCISHHSFPVLGSSAIPALQITTSFS